MHAPGGANVMDDREARACAFDERTEWHLTPRGWERGVSSLSRPDCPVGRPPAGCSRSRRYTKCVSRAFFGGADRSFVTTWRSPDGTALATLLEKFGEHPFAFADYRDATCAPPAGVGEAGASRASRSA